MEASIVHELSELEVHPKEAEEDPDFVKLFARSGALGVVHSGPEVLLGLVKCLLQIPTRRKFERIWLAHRLV